MRSLIDLTTSALINSRFDYGLKRECVIQYRSLGSLIPSTQWDYLHHIGIWNNFQEDNKSTPDHFLSSFKSLVINYDESLTSPVLVDPSSYSLVNGSHRLAFHGLETSLPAYKYVDSPYRYDSSFFESYTNPLTAQRFPLTLLQRMAVYNTYHQDLNAVIVFPKAVHTDSAKYADNLIRQHLTVSTTYDFTLPLSYLPLLVLHLYPQHPWIWKKQAIQHAAVNHKANEICNPYGLQHVRLYLVNDLPSKVLPIKQMIRRYYNIGNDSVHASDNSRECSLLFEFLQSSRLLAKTFPCIDINSPTIHAFFSAPLYRHYTQRHPHLHYSVVSGTTIFNLAGCGNASDLDLLFPKLPGFPAGHQSFEYFFGTNTDSLPLSLRNTVSILGYRCLQPHLVSQMKTSRNEPKDRLIPRQFKYP
jgi:hypothetical protein